MGGARETALGLILVVFWGVLALSSLVERVSAQTNGGSLQTDIAVLLALKAAVVDKNGALVGWNVSNNDTSAPCDWRGVFCTRGRVSEIQLPTLGLSGVLPGLSSFAP